METTPATKTDISALDLTTTSPRTPQMEILAPVANWDMCQAAVQSGADAIYLGVPGFNARGRTPTLEFSELQTIITYCHEHRVKVFFAFNVLVFEDELQTVTSIIELLRSLHPDALIVQDIGLVRLLRAAVPEIPIHASTQMTVTNSEAISLLDGLGIVRYVLARELSMTEIARIRAQTTTELEVFVHGALCVSYSGQCLTSERIGGRSANRGQCAQTCRMPYELIVDGKKKDLGERTFLVSPQDLCSLYEVENLKRIGVSSLKIEGRLKSPEYVASTVHAYRTMRDGASGTEAPPDAAPLRAELEVLYSRGFFPGWLNGVNHQRLVDGRTSSHHGHELGAVIRVQPGAILIRAHDRLAGGDGLVFCDFSGKREVGGTVYAATPPNKEGIISIDCGRSFAYATVKPGMIAFLNSAPRIAAAVRRRFTNRETRETQQVDLAFTGAVGAPLSITATTEHGERVTVASTKLLEPATKQPLTLESVQLAVGKLSKTPFHLGQISLEFASPVFFATREIKELRRAVIAALLAHRVARSTVIDPVSAQSALKNLLALRQTSAAAPSLESQTLKLNVLLRSADQIPALAGLDLGLVYLDFEFGKEYGPSLELLKSMNLTGAIATTRILKPGEMGHLHQIRRLKPAAVLVRNLGALQYFQDSGIPLIGDFSLNAANSLTAEWLSAQGLSRFTPSYDLNQQQLGALLKTGLGSTAEVVVHQYMPAFHMEHCVFAAFLSSGTSYRDCGRPCEKHKVELRDASGTTFPLKPDAECRNTMFHGTAQSAARLVQSLAANGVTNFRVEALNETAAELREKVLLYLKVLQQAAVGEEIAAEITQQLGALERYGVSEGQLFQIKGYRSRVGERG